MLLSPMTLENDLQIAVNEYLNYLSKSYRFRHFHVPNEGNRPVSYKVKLKKMGLKAGCPDIIIEKLKKGGCLILKNCGLYNQKLWEHPTI